jgi:CBS domain-containing protein
MDHNRSLDNPSLVRYLSDAISSKIVQGAPTEMAPRKRRAASQHRQFKIRLPGDITARIEAKAQAEGRPQNRVIINELAAFPALEKQRKLAELVDEFELLTLRHEARLGKVELQEDLFGALHEVLQADDANNVGEVRAGLSKVRVILIRLEKHAK